MRHRTGYVHEDKKTGKVYARLTFIDEAGKRRSLLRLAQNRTHAWEILKQLNWEINEGGSRTIDGARMTVADLCDRYAATYCKPAVFVDGRKVSGLRDLRHVERYVRIIREHFGARLLRSLTFGDILAFKLQQLQTPTQ